MNIKQEIEKIDNIGKESTETITTSNLSNGQSSSEVYLNFSFFKVDPKWRWLNEIGKDEAAKEFANLLDVARTKMTVKAYSTLGLHNGVDFMIWMVSNSIENIQVLTSKIYTTILGKYLESALTYLSASRKSIYVDKSSPGFKLTGKDQPMKYLVVYPFIKSREWYLLPFEDRKRMMEEHIMSARKFPHIRLNTSYSFGLDDQDFMLAFETDSLGDFQDLIVSLRETQVSSYVVRDTPMIVCVYKEITEIVKSLG
jgi:chlorite dismutase